MYFTDPFLNFQFLKHATNWNFWFILFICKSRFKAMKVQNFFYALFVFEETSFLKQEKNLRIHFNYWTLVFYSAFNKNGTVDLNSILSHLFLCSRKNWLFFPMLAVSLIFFCYRIITLHWFFFCHCVEFTQKEIFADQRSSSAYSLIVFFIE